MNFYADELESVASGLSDLRVPATVAEIEKLAEKIEGNRILKGSIGPLFNMGWDAANKASAEMVRALAAKQRGASGAGC